MAKSVQALLDDIRLLGAMQIEVVEAVRALVHRSVTPLEEEVKYGGILFSSGVMFAGVFAYREHVSVEFSRGADIEDADGLLEGQGKGRRHLKFRSVHDIEGKRLAHYLPLALDAARSTGRGDAA